MYALIFASLAAKKYPIYCSDRHQHGPDRHSIQIDVRRIICICSSMFDSVDSKQRIY
jgi:hypothetical protein